MFSRLSFTVGARLGNEAACLQKRLGNEDEVFTFTALIRCFRLWSYPSHAFFF